MRLDYNISRQIIKELVMDKCRTDSPQYHIDKNDIVLSYRDEIKDRAKHKEKLQCLLDSFLWDNSDTPTELLKELITDSDKLMFIMGALSRKIMYTKKDDFESLQKILEAFKRELTNDVIDYGIRNIDSNTVDWSNY